MRNGLADEAAIVNAENVPRLDAGLSWHTAQLELDYAPQMTFVDIFGSGSSPVLWLHSAAAQFRLSQPRFTVRLVQTGTWGDQELLPLATSQGVGPVQPVSAQPTPNQPVPPASGGPMGPTLNLLPNAHSLPIANEETSADLSAALSRRWHTSTRASYGFSGGADETAQMVWPRQRRAQLDNAVAFDESRRDQLSTVFTGARLEISNGYEHWLASLSENWAARWSTATGTSIGAGIAFQDSTAPDRTTTTHWGPIGSVNFTHALALDQVRLRLQIGLAYAPELIAVLGTVQNRLQFTSSATAFKGPWSVGFTLASMQTIPASASDAASMASAALAFEYEVRKWLGAQLGGMITQQKLTSLIGTTGGMWLVFAGIVAHAPEQRF